MFELRVIEHERLVSKDKENNKAVLSRLMHSKKRRHESHDESMGATAFAAQDSQEASEDSPAQSSVPQRSESVSDM